MSGELKPCPFCGGKNISHEYKHGIIWCVDCSVSGPTVALDYKNLEATNEECVRLWNLRAI